MPDTGVPLGFRAVWVNTQIDPPFTHLIYGRDPRTLCGRTPKTTVHDHNLIELRCDRCWEYTDKRLRQARRASEAKEYGT